MLEPSTDASGELGSCAPNPTPSGSSVTLASLSPCLPQETAFGPETSEGLLSLSLHLSSISPSRCSGYLMTM